MEFLENIFHTNNKTMKTDQAATYNHMQDEESTTANQNSHHPISLYMIFAVDVIIVGFIVYAGVKIWF